jgi:uncharacterized membrane protein
MLSFGILNISPKKQFSHCFFLQSLSNLQEVINTQPLDKVILFSSIASLTGPAGSATYAAANAVLDVAASSFTATGIQSAAIQWGAWAEIGMVYNSHAVQQAMKRSGVGMVYPLSGLSVISTLLGSQQVNLASLLAAIPFNWDTFMKIHKNKTAAIYAEFLPEAQATVASLHNNGEAQSEKPNLVLSQVLETILLCIEVTQGTAIEANMPLIQAGVDSLGKCNAAK